MELIEFGLDYCQNLDLIVLLFVNDFNNSFD